MWTPTEQGWRAAIGHLRIEVHRHHTRGQAPYLVYCQNIGMAMHPIEAGSDHEGLDLAAKAVAFALEDMVQMTRQRAREYAWGRKQERERREREEAIARIQREARQVR